MNALVQHEWAIRLAAFTALFVVMSVLEVFIGERPLTVPRATRWRRHGVLLLLNSVLVRLLFPAGAVGAAVFAERHGLGLLRVVDLPPAVLAVGAFVMLDFLLWLQHVMFHAVPRLFALHQVHHADRDFDASLGVRFHPLEMILSMVLKWAMVLLIGVPSAVVVLFEIVLSLTSIFNHANVRLSGPVDRVLRWFVVTPAMHRIHHSAAAGDLNTNFGFNLPWWDHLCGTYRRAADGPIVVGMAQYSDATRQSLLWMLALPFRSGPVPANEGAGAAGQRPLIEATAGPS